jgi:Ca2+-binding EF-hand superfamily protein
MLVSMRAHLCGWLAIALLSGLATPLPSLQEEVPPAPKQEQEQEEQAEEDEIAKWRREMEEGWKERAAADFEICDRDGNGWVSFKEANETLEMAKADFRRHDADKDGKLEPGEFEARFIEIMERSGAVGAPRLRSEAEDFLLPEDPEASPTPMLPVDILNLFDEDGSRGLGLDELQSFHEQAGVEISCALLLAEMDPDGSGELEVGELSPVISLVMRRRRLDAAQRDAAIEEAILEADRPSGRVSVAPLPPEVPRAPQLFPRERLDPDGDGAVSVRELDELLAPARVNLRAAAILAALDRDRDGKLSAEELRLSMTR